ncbi:general stress protein [Sphingomonas sp. PB4P5]|uniref:general stress protein n=1 Tax=Parasphingomonas puruogangriensis TaxID=3096155 RepID=UPI002FCCAC59
MNSNLVSAVFDNHAEAERAVSELRSAGVNDSAISIVAQHDGKNTTTDGSGETQEFVGKVAAGAGIGTILGIAALAIPGVGPLVAAGAIASAAIPAAALTGAALGGAAGGLEKVMTDHGVSSEDATYYNDRVNDGGVFVSVDTSAAGISAEDATDVLYRLGGHSSSRSRIAAI